MPFCPQCELEYLGGVTTCSDCGVTLVVAPTDSHFTGDLLPLYMTGDLLEANLISDLLKGRAIDCMVRAIAPFGSPFHMPSQNMWEILVTPDTKAIAKAALEEAREAGMLSPRGRFASE